MREILYPQYLGMRAYASCDMDETWPLELHFRMLEAMDPESEINYPEAVAALPLAPRLRDTLWRSLVLSRAFYHPSLVQAAGRFLAAVCLEHLQTFRRLVRAEFLMAAVWTRTVDWLADEIAMLQEIDGRACAGLAQALKIACEMHSSPVRILIDREHARGYAPDFAESGNWFLPWGDPRFETDSPQSLLTGVVTEDVLLDPPTEKELNASLHRVLGGLTLEDRRS